MKGRGAVATPVPLPDEVLLVVYDGDAVPGRAARRPLPIADALSRA